MTMKGAPIDPRNFCRESRVVRDEAGRGHCLPYELHHPDASLMIAQGSSSVS